MIIDAYSNLTDLENNTTNFPFLANSYYWPCTETNGTTLAEVTGGPSYDPSGTLGFTTNGVNIANNSIAPSLSLDLSRIGINDNLLMWVCGTPDFATTNAGFYLTNSAGPVTDYIGITQNATQTIFVIDDGSNTTASLVATVANAELQNQVCAIMIKNSTGTTGGTITADYYIVSAGDASIATGALTATGIMNAGLPITPTSQGIAISKYPTGTGILNSFGIIKLSTTPSATQIRGFLGWMSKQIKTNQKRGLYPGWKGLA